MGTARHGRKSEHMAQLVFEQLKKREGVEAQYFDVKDYLTCITNPPEEPNPKSEEWKKHVLETDGFIVVAPEYNHSYPGELKILLDEAFKEYEKRCAVVVSVSKGGFGGVRLVELMHQLISTLKMVPVPSPVNVSKINDVFDEDGKLLEEAYLPKIEKMLDQLLWYAKILKQGREQG